MMRGRIQNRQAIVPVTFHLPGKPRLTLEFVVDTGFAGFLTLPIAAVAALSLEHEYDTRANLADNSEIQLPVHAAVIEWEGEEREVRVLATGRRPLLGTALLDGSKLVAQFVEGGLVAVGSLE